LSRLDTAPDKQGQKLDDAPVKSIQEIAQLLGVKYDRLGIDVGSLPFALDDTTAGSESEMQTAVSGNKDNVDLPVIIAASNYFTNTRRRASVGDTLPKVMTGLGKYSMTLKPTGLFSAP